MASMVFSTVNPQSLLIPSSRGEAIATTSACSEHLKSTRSIGHCTKSRLLSISTINITSRGQRRLSIVRATVDEEESSSQKSSSTAVDKELENATTSGTVGNNLGVDGKAAARAEIQRGRNTAIITGAISVLLGVGYLVLLQLLDTRGIELIPPPPEAFNP